MNKSLLGMLIPVLAVTGCAAPTSQGGSEGAKPITVISPDEATPLPFEPTSSATPTPTPDAKEPRETDFNHDDVGFVAESAIRDERMVKLTQEYLSKQPAPTSASAIAVALHDKYQKSLERDRKFLQLWGISNPAKVVHTSVAGIPSDADIAQMKSLSGHALDERFLTLAASHVDRAAAAAKEHLEKGYNQEVLEDARGSITDLEKQKASISEALQSQN